MGGLAGLPPHSLSSRAAASLRAIPARATPPHPPVTAPAHHMGALRLGWPSEGAEGMGRPLRSWRGGPAPARPLLQPATHPRQRHASARADHRQHKHQALPPAGEGCEGVAADGRQVDRQGAAAAVEALRVRHQAPLHRAGAGWDTGGGGSGPSERARVSASQCAMLCGSLAARLLPPARHLVHPPTHQHAPHPPPRLAPCRSLTSCSPSLIDGDWRAPEA